MSLDAIFITIILIWLAVMMIGLLLWRKGNRERNIPMIIIGAFMFLNILGVTIAIMQINSWEKRWYEENQIIRNGEYKTKFNELLKIREYLTEEEFRREEQKIRDELKAQNN